MSKKCKQFYESGRKNSSSCKKDFPLIKKALHGTKFVFVNYVIVLCHYPFLCFQNILEKEKHKGNNLTSQAKLFSVATKQKIAYGRNRKEKF